MLVFPTLLILTFLGREFALGSTQSLASLITAAAVYFYGTRASPNLKLPKLYVGVLFAVSGAALLLLLPVDYGIICYIVLSGMAFSFLPAIVVPMAYDVIAESVSDQDQVYHYVVDREVWVNVGRLMLLPLVAYASYSSSSSSYLFVAAALVNSMQILLIPLVRGALQVAKRLEQEG